MFKNRHFKQCVLLVNDVDAVFKESWVSEARCFVSLTSVFWITHLRSCFTNVGISQEAAEAIALVMPLVFASEFLGLAQGQCCPSDHTDPILNIVFVRSPFRLLAKINIHSVTSFCSILIQFIKRHSDQNRYCSLKLMLLVIKNEPNKLVPWNGYNKGVLYTLIFINKKT